MKTRDAHSLLFIACGLVLLAGVTGCATAPTQTGLASYYTVKTNHGRQTASGERFRPKAMTAAHRTLPFDTRVKVTNLRNGKSVKVRINDRGPYVEGRIIDLTKAAARRLDMLDAGVVPVKVEVLD